MSQIPKAACLAEALPELLKAFCFRAARTLLLLKEIAKFVFEFDESLVDELNAASVVTSENVDSLCEDLTGLEYCGADSTAVLCACSALR
ncbi:hypothetical protein [Nocardia farcinica]|uniref:hypothetical protein n=1 Tax=Nocardia farcinica TaxID=37329 RepID=UPI002453A86E|nr:hypothetical protein [Nocardia farcinica]